MSAPVILKCRGCGRAPWPSEPTTLVVTEAGTFRSHVECARPDPAAQRLQPSRHQEVKYQRSRRRERSRDE